MLLAQCLDIHCIFILPQLSTPSMSPNGHLFAPCVISNTWTARGRRAASYSNRSLSLFLRPFLWFDWFGRRKWGVENGGHQGSGNWWDEGVQCHNIWLGWARLGASIYFFRKIFGVLTPPCYCHKSADLFLLSAFLGPPPPWPLRTSYMEAPFQEKGSSVNQLFDWKPIFNTISCSLHPLNAILTQISLCGTKHKESIFSHLASREAAWKVYS